MSKSKIYSFVGLDIGGSTIKFCTIKNEAVANTKLITFASHSRSVNEFENELEAYFEDHKLSYANSTIGVSLGGMLKDGVITKWPNRPDWEGFDLRTCIKNKGIQKVFFLDDAFAAGFHELFFGRFRDADSGLYISFGTGIGSCFRLANEIYGDKGRAEIGHYSVKGESILCSCGKHGCLQALYKKTSMDDPIARSKFFSTFVFVVSNILNFLDIKSLYLSGVIFKKSELKVEIRKLFQNKTINICFIEETLISTMLGLYSFEKQRGVSCEY